MTELIRRGDNLVERRLPRGQRFGTAVITQPMDEVFGLFPTPFMRARATLPAPLVAGLVDHFTKRATRDNNSSSSLSHTEMLRPGDSPLLGEAAALIAPKLVEFGVHLFGERLEWLLKEMWVNVLDSGGRQAMHNLSLIHI